MSKEEEGNNTALVSSGYDQPAANAHSVTVVKLPSPFWHNNSSRYFTVAEMKFEIHRITSDESKYSHIATHLDGDLLDIIDSPQADGKYEALKHRIIRSLSESQMQNFVVCFVVNPLLTKNRLYSFNVYEIYLQDTMSSYLIAPVGFWPPVSLQI